MVRIRAMVTSTGNTKDESMGQSAAEFSRYARRPAFPVANAAFSIIFH